MVHGMDIPAKITRNKIGETRAAKIVHKTYGGLYGVIMQVEGEQIVCLCWDKLPVSLLLVVLAILTQCEVDNVRILCAKKGVHRGYVLWEVAESIESLECLDAELILFLPPHVFVRS